MNGLVNPSIKDPTGGNPPPLSQFFDSEFSAPSVTNRYNSAFDDPATG